MATPNSGVYYDGLVSQTPQFMHVRFDADIASMSLRCRSAILCKDGAVYPWDFLVPEDLTSLRGTPATVPMTKKQLLEIMHEQITKALAIETLEAL
jgi:hypothetical protein